MAATRKKCEPGCTCKRHQRGKVSEETRQKMREAHLGPGHGSGKCPPDCTCGRHTRNGRTIDPERRLNIVKANKERKGPRKKCPEGCACGRHTARYRGGSQKGRTFSREAKRNIALAAQAARKKMTPEQRVEYAERLRQQRESPEFEERRINGLKAHWAIARGTDEATRGVKLSSQKEYLIAPHLAREGYIHNTGIGQIKIGRRCPDFVDFPNRRVLEFFGDYWHVPEEEQETVDYYADQGWQCIVLWESDLQSWLASQPCGIVSALPE